MKAFLRWYADSTIGRLDEIGKPTVRTTKACAEKFFGGFKEVTKTEVPETDRKEIYGVSSRFSFFRGEYWPYCRWHAVDKKHLDETGESRESEKTEVQLQKRRLFEGSFFNVEG